jgi:hypothetical protein
MTAGNRRCSASNYTSARCIGWARAASKKTKTHDRFALTSEGAAVQILN